MYPFVNVKITFKGNPLGKKFYDEHSKIHHLYPSQAAFSQLYQTLYSRTQEEGKEQLLEISENAIWVNGKPTSFSDLFKQTTK